MPSVDELLGPPPADHLLGPDPAKGKPAAAPPADHLLGPPPADHLLGPEPAPAAAPRPKPRNPALAAPRKSGQPAPRITGSKLGSDIVQRDIVEPWKRAGHDLTDKPTGNFLSDLGRSLRGPFDVGMGAVGSTLGLASDAVLGKPIGELAAKVPAYQDPTKTGGKLVRRDPKEIEEEFRGAAMKGLGAVRPGGKLSKMPDFGPGFAKPHGFEKTPAAPVPDDPAMPTYGAEKNRVERLDNALHRNRGGHTADKLELMKFVKGLPQAAKDPAAQERLYHELEQALVDPKRKLSPESEALLDHFRHYYEEQTNLVNDIRRMGAKSGAPVEDYLHDQGYVARRAQGHTPTMDSLTEPVDPVTGKGSPLNKSTTALRSRMKAVMLQPKKGAPIWVDSDLVAKNPGRYELGSTVKGSGGKAFKVRQPTTAEIEANTDVRYHKNALVNTVDNVVRLRQVQRNMKMLDAALSDLKGAGLAHRESWMAPVKGTGHNGGPPLMTPQTNPTEAPDHFVELKNIPQLKGWKFDPSVAEVFKDYKPDPKAPHWEVLEKVNNMLTSSMFWNPIPHIWNVGNHWAVGRGFDWFTPGGMRSLARNGARAVHAVMTQNADYRAMLREGSGLQAGNTEARNFHELMFNKGVSEIARDRTAMSTLMHSFDLKGVSPQRVIGAVYKASQKALWRANDILLLQRQYELMDKGMPARQAIAEAEKDIPNYRIPSKVMGSRAVSTAMRDPNLMLFGRYRYGQLKAWGSLFKDLYKGSPAERTDAAGRFLVAAILAGGVYPMLDAAAQKVTGNPDARMHRGGGFSIPDAASQMEKGQKSWLGFMSSIWSMPAAYETGMGIATNRDVFGKRIVEPGSTPKEKAMEAGEYAGSRLNPVALAVQSTKDEGLARAAARTLGVDMPKSDARKQQRRSESYNRRDAAKRRKKDPLVGAAEDLP